MDVDADVDADPATAPMAIREGVFMDGAQLRTALGRVPDAHRQGVADMLRSNWALGTDAVRRFSKGDVGDGDAFMQFCATLMDHVTHVARYGNDMYYYVTYACLDRDKRRQLFGDARFNRPKADGGALREKLTIGDVRRDETLRRLAHCEFVGARSVKRRVVPLLHFTRRKLGEVYDHWPRLVSATSWQSFTLPEGTFMDNVAKWYTQWFQDVGANMRELFRAAVARDDAWRDYEAKYRYLGIPFELWRLDSKTRAHSVDALYSDVAYVVRQIHVPLSVTPTMESAFTPTLFAPLYYRYDTRSGAARWGIVGGPTFFRQYAALRRGRADAPFTVRCCAGLTQLQQLQTYMRLLCVHPDDYLLLGYASRLCFTSRTRRNRLALTKLMDANAAYDAWPLTRLPDVNIGRVNARRGGSRRPRSGQSPVQTWRAGAPAPADEREWLLCAEAALESEWARRSYAVIEKPYVCDAATLDHARALPPLEPAPLVEPAPMLLRDRLQLLIDLKRRQQTVEDREKDVEAEAAAENAAAAAENAAAAHHPAREEDDMHDVGAYDGDEPFQEALEEEEEAVAAEPALDAAGGAGLDAASHASNPAAGDAEVPAAAAAAAARRRRTPVVIKSYFLRSHARSVQGQRRLNRMYLSILDDSYKPKGRPRRK